MRLEVGGVSDSVTVSAGGTLLQTETASRGMNVDSRLVTDLPVANHNPMMLGQTLQGVYMRPLGAYTDPWTITSQFMINGGLMYLNELQVDGAPNNAQFGNNVYGYSPPMKPSRKSASRPTATMRFGTTDRAPAGMKTGGPNSGGGPIATAGGLVFIGASKDSVFHAFASRTGEELWSPKLEEIAQSVPITWQGRDDVQYVGIAAGSKLLTFRLPPSEKR